MIMRYIYLSEREETHSDIFGMFSFCYPDHPQEFVDVIPWVADDSAENNQHVIDVEGYHDFVSLTFIGGHRFADL